MVRLWLPVAGEDFARYRVSLQTPEGGELWSEDGSTAHGNGSGRRLEARIPAPLLRPGTYVVIVSGIAADGRPEPAAEYVFRVTREANGARP
jgi:hypothetical protein